MKPVKRDEAAAKPLTREEARLKLEAAGLLSEEPYAADDIRPLSDSERARLAALFADTPSSEDILNEDRGLY